MGIYRIALVESCNKSQKENGNYKDALSMIGKDTLSAGIGLIISLILAMSINENMRQEFFNLF